MQAEETLALESNGLLDFPLTPPDSAEDEVPISQDKQSLFERRPDSPVLGYGSPPPPEDYDEEPSDFEDEVRGIMVREQRSMSGGPNGDVEMEIDDETMPVASSSKTRREVVLTPPPDLSEQYGTATDDRPDDTMEPESEARFELLPMFESIAPLLVETSSGRTVVFKRRAKPRPKPIPREGRGGTTAGGSNLLSVPLHKLLAEVDELKAQQEAIKLQNRYDAESRLNEHLGKGKYKGMWVDKYRPKKFSDLLGEDRVHRDVMGWLKEWDKCVFKRANPVKKRRYNETEEEHPYHDYLGRPKDRVLLLSGPPGYGKTTLAHIVAQQAGYRTLEINASDDRSAATVTTRIKNAIDAGSGLASEGRPTCVVIDEIDGASGGGDASFVRSLIKLIQDVPARKKTNTPAKPLRRPIICICNDLYATSLRPLRPFARVIRFKKPQAQFLIKRLREICDREGLEADLRVLTQLAEMTSGDVRSCLNTLQFIKSKSPIVTYDLLKSSSLGLKDTGTSLQTVWDSLTIPVAAKQRRKTQGIDDGKYVDKLAFAVQASGDYDKLVQGLWEHYPDLSPQDKSLANLDKVHDWIMFYDRLAGRVGETQEYELMSFMSYGIVPWYTHMASAANNAKHVEWPKTDYEAYVTRTANEEIATSLKGSIPPILRSLFSPTTTMTELVPFMMRIISPPLRPVNANIVKPAEKAVLNRLVELMIPLGLKFWVEKGESGQPMMRLEPPIDVFVHYEGKRADDIAASRFAVRQLVAQAMDAEIARRRGQADGSTAMGTRESLQGMYGAAKQGKKVDTTTEVIATDFFGRPLAKPNPASVPLEGEESMPAVLEPIRKKFKALYKFHEGSSSAVRKSVKMNTLM